MSTQLPLDSLRSSLWRLFLTAHTRLLERMEQKLAQADLPSMEWYDVLYTLKEAPDHRLRLSDLADKVLLSRSNLTRLVDRLERAGLLCRQSCPNDRRGTFAVLTEAGLAMQEQMWAVYSEAIAAHFATHISDEEAQLLQPLLKRLIAAAETEM
ncbi:MarR family transcriptional regulator [Pseudanabaena sp. FACHB-2040]|uniref:MarR family winged helix-turn-helix transcriptional regulator n=1 Tax=Pseudanabaena sp. FACHB-2040 TaxID=2692859 RepID=UPI001687B097|nr:MarR family transcriptional regulator [Pseudanabaena sp. FACHB-2040]MBD2257705.1 MarR family transcriptional regulator [Pseudanabaena sp. FACHB-2040]